MTLKRISLDLTDGILVNPIGAIFWMLVGAMLAALPMMLTFLFG